MPPLSENTHCSTSLNVSLNDRNAHSGSKTNRRPTQRLQELKAVVEKAIQNHKTFTVLGPFGCIKNALKLRGWIEKFESRLKYEKKQETSTPTLVEPGSEGSSKSDSTLGDIQISRLLRDYCVDFIWTMKNEPIKWKKLTSKTLISRFPRAEFTTKAGLCSSLQQPHWFYEEGVSGVLLPRCFNISNEDELSAFIENFRLTACISLVRLVYECCTEDKIIFQKDGTIPISSIDYAFQRCKEYIAQQQHIDIDQRKAEKVWDHQWDQFLTNYYKVIHDNELFACSEDEEDVVTVREQCNELLSQLGNHWPQLNLDGTNNLWIIKPAAKSRGRGILIVKRLEDILAKLNSQYAKECRYVAQKYIERPLLIYETKFDIRQWFLVTSAYPLIVWMYKESYLRFCSQIFSLMNTHESVHLSNNAIQCKYTNGVRDSNLPDENMWDCYTFQTYLRSKGNPEVWETLIYPGMRKNIIGALLASQDTMDTRKNCFELYGADFMLSEDFRPWLIEINSGPSMSPSTSVTARMCAQVLDDVIKVVIDRKYDKNANTGMFELVYKQIIPPTQPYMGQNLVVRGTKVENCRTRASKTTRKPIIVQTAPKKRKFSNLAAAILSAQCTNQIMYSDERAFSARNNKAQVANRLFEKKSANKNKSTRSNLLKDVQKENIAKKDLTGKPPSRQRRDLTTNWNHGLLLENLKKVIMDFKVADTYESRPVAEKDIGLSQLPFVFNKDVTPRKSNPSPTRRTMESTEMLPQIIVHSG